MVDSRSRIAACALLSFSLASISANARESSGPPGGNSQPLQQKVETFFLTETDQDRESAIKSILADPDADVPRVALAIRSASLWKPLTTPVGELTYKTTESEMGRAAFRAPSEYDHTRAYPLLICLPGPSETQSPGPVGTEWCQKLLADRSGEFILVSPERLPPADWHENETATRMIHELLRAARRLFHSDASRTYLIGWDRGADAGWNVLLSNADPFAAAILLSGRPRLPHPAQSVPLLLPNLGATSVGVDRFESPNPNRDRVRPTEVAWTGLLTLWSAEQGYELTSSPQDPGEPLSADLLSLLSRSRAPFPKTVHQQFRPAGAGWVGWLRAPAVSGEASPDEVISIRAGAGVDRDSYISGVLVGRLHSLDGRASGQDIEVETTGCKEVELRLPLEGIDWTQPITIRCNGQMRSGKRLPSQVRTLLECAAEEWDFQRLVGARLSFRLVETSSKQE